MTRKQFCFNTIWSIIFLNTHERTLLAFNLYFNWYNKFSFFLSQVFRLCWTVSWWRWFLCSTSRCWSCSSWSSTPSSDSSFSQESFTGSASTMSQVSYEGTFFKTFNLIQPQNPPLFTTDLIWSKYKRCWKKLDLDFAV